MGFEIENGVFVKYKKEPKIREDEVTVPDGVTCIGRDAFYSCRSVRKIIIPEGVTKIEFGAFSFCENLTEVILPESLISIDNAAFYGCTSLRRVTMHEGLTFICKHVFYNCIYLNEITIPQSVKSIGEYTFYNCSNLTEVTIPDGVESIGDYTFNSCEKLTKVNILNGKIKIQKNTFGNCPFLQEIFFPEGSISDVDDKTKKYLVAGFINNSELYDCEISKTYIDFLKRGKKNFLKPIFDNDDLDHLLLFDLWGLITLSNLEKFYLNPALEADAKQCIAYLLDWKNKNTTAEGPDRDFFKEFRL